MSNIRKTYTREWARGTIDKMCGAKHIGAGEELDICSKAKGHDGAHGCSLITETPNEEERAPSGPARFTAADAAE